MSETVFAERRMSKKQNAEEDYITTPISVLSYITALESQLEEAREAIYKYAEIALMEGKDEFGHSWEDFKFYVLDEQLKEQEK